jgi:hypothetical protein
MRRVSKAVAVAVVVVSLNASHSFAAERQLRPAPQLNKKTSIIQQLLRRFAPRVLDGGDMSVPKP